MVGHCLVAHHEGTCALHVLIQKDEFSLRPSFFSPPVICDPDGDHKTLVSSVNSAMNHKETSVVSVMPDLHSHRRHYIHGVFFA